MLCVVFCDVTSFSSVVSEDRVSSILMNTSLHCYNLKMLWYLVPWKCWHITTKLRKVASQKIAIIISATEEPQISRILPLFSFRHILLRLAGGDTVFLGMYVGHMWAQTIDEWVEHWWKYTWQGRTEIMGSKRDPGLQLQTSLGISLDPSCT
jgi:hypothetical protein